MRRRPGRARSGHALLLARRGVRAVPGRGLRTLVPDLAAEAAAVRTSVVGVLLAVERQRPLAELDAGGGAQQALCDGGTVDAGVARAAEPRRARTRRASSCRTSACTGSSPGSTMSQPGSLPMVVTSPRSRKTPGGPRATGTGDGARISRGFPPPGGSCVVVTGCRDRGGRWARAATAVAGGSRSAVGRAPPLGPGPGPGPATTARAPRSMRMCREPVSRRCSQDVRGDAERHQRSRRCDDRDRDALAGPAPAASPRIAPASERPAKTKGSLTRQLERLAGPGQRTGDGAPAGDVDRELEVGVDRAGHGHEVRACRTGSVSASSRW